MNITQLMASVGLAFALAVSTVFAGVVDPDCTAEKAKDAVKK